MAYVDIEDTGPGMSEAELAQIFEPFARGAAAGQSATGTPGAGLGLTIAKMLTDLMGGEMTVLSTPGQGSVFRVRLFLPEVHGVAGSGKGLSRAPLRRRPQGYAGQRRKILVVDNEEPDRELLVQLLQPMGFELRTAASGHDCLDLLAAGLQPDAIFMDLAMPGIDGWETIRRLRLLEQGLPAAAPSQITDALSEKSKTFGGGDAGGVLVKQGPQNWLCQAAGAAAPSGGSAVREATSVGVAIVSANAFDRGLDNDVGIRPEDFILKPVRHTELLDWLERRLGLRWLYEPAAETPVLPQPQVAPRQLPDAAQLAGLLEVVNLGFYRGIMNKLAEIETCQPATADFVSDMRALARQFQFEAMARQLASPETGLKNDA
jgi:CheY-like chemotaxis protein